MILIILTTVSSLIFYIFNKHYGDIKKITYQIAEINFFTFLIFIWRFISERNLYSGYTFEYYFLLFSKRVDGKLVNDIFLNPSEVPHTIFVNLINVALRENFYFELMLVLYIIKSILYALVLSILFEESKSYKFGSLYFLLIFSASLNVFGHVVLSNVFAPQDLGLVITLIYILFIYKRNKPNIAIDLITVAFVSIAHAYWALYILGLVTFVNLFFFKAGQIFFKRFITFFVTYFSISRITTNSINIFDTFELSKIQYFEKVSPTHFNFFNLEGGRCYNSLNTGFSEIYPAIIFTLLSIAYLKAIKKNNLFSYIVYLHTFFALGSFISLIFKNSIINDIFVAFDIWRIQTLWLVIGLLVVFNIPDEIKHNNKVFYFAIAFYLSHWPCIDSSILNYNPANYDYSFMYILRLSSILLIIKPKKIDLSSLLVCIASLFFLNLFLYYPILNTILCLLIYISIQNPEQRSKEREVLPISIMLFVLSIMPISLMSNTYPFNFSNEKLQYVKNEYTFKNIRELYSFDKPVLFDPSNDVIRYFGEVPSFFSKSTRPYSLNKAMVYLERMELLKNFNQLELAELKSIMQDYNLEFLILTKKSKLADNYIFEHFILLEIENDELIERFNN